MCRELVMKDSICFRRKSSINNAAYRALRLDSLTSTIIEGSVKRHNAIIFLEYRLRSLYRFVFVLYCSLRMSSSISMSI